MDGDCTPRNRRRRPRNTRAATEAGCTAPSLVATIAPSAIGEPVRASRCSRRVGRGDRDGAGALPRRRRDGAGRHRADGAADQLPRGPAGVVESPRGAARRRRHERHHPESDRRRVRRRRTVARCSAASPPTAATRATSAGVRPPRRAAARARRSGLGAQRRGDRNLGYMQMKKTHDAAMVLIERMYGERPRFNYYIGTSQGGREALTVAQRYPADYDGIVANVPIVELLVADARARADSHPGEAGRQLGDARQGQRDSRRVHAPVRRARRPGRRRHQQLHGLPRDLRREPGRAQPPSVGREALPEQRRSEPGGHERERVPDRRPDLDARVRLLALPVRDAARQRRARRSACGCRTPIRRAAG